MKSNLKAAVMMPKHNSGLLLLLRNICQLLYRITIKHTSLIFNEYLTLSKPQKFKTVDNKDHMYYGDSN